MEEKWIHRAAWVVGILGAVILVAPAWAHECSLHQGGRQCVTPEPTCPDVDVTQATVRIGGEGSVDTEHDCTCSPGSDAEGNIVEADLTFEWDRDGATAGTLTLTATNASPNFNPKITKIWFNLPAGVDACSLVSADVNGSDVTAGWELIAPGIGEGCLGDFEQQLRTRRGIQDSIPNLQTGTFVLSCTGTGLDTVDACQFANEGTNTDVGERSSTAAMHFQTTDQTGQLSDKVSTCAEDLFVELASFEAEPEDGRVRLSWETFLEIDNAGFYLLRHDVVSGATTTITPGMIPAQGDIFQGARYEFVDETAVNGVEYEYILVDVDLSGLEAQHRGLYAVANPDRPAIRLVAPTYGSSELRQGAAPSFRWEARSPRAALLMASTDPTFQDRSRTLTFGARGDEGLTLAPGQARRLERLAAQSGGVIYWRVVQPTLSGRMLTSPTYRAAYGVLAPDSGAPGSRVPVGAAPNGEEGVDQKISGRRGLTRPRR